MCGELFFTIQIRRYKIMWKIKFFYDFADIAIVMFSSKVYSDSQYNMEQLLNAFSLFFYLEMPGYRFFDLKQFNYLIFPLWLFLFVFRRKKFFFFSYFFR